MLLPLIWKLSELQFKILPGKCLVLQSVILPGIFFHVTVVYFTWKISSVIVDLN